jgi:hypothetical protein
MAFDQAVRPGRLSRRGGCVLLSYERVPRAIPDIRLVLTASRHSPQWPSRNGLPASGAEAPSRPEGHARTTRVGGATRRALHGAEHRLMLNDVMATGVSLVPRAQTES